MKTMVLSVAVSPTLKLPADGERQQQLRDKLREYATRTTEEARYKRLILSRVLEEKEVRSLEIETYVEAEIGPTFDRRLFLDCCNVIDDYCKTGGSRTVLGSGLGGR